nr:RES family NAD+ phosphorylase [Actinomycetales bacterium]
MVIKNPGRPPGTLEVLDEDVLEASPVLARIHATGGAHPSAWNSVREWGPVDTCRWDPHPLPAGQWPGSGVTYAASDVKTAVAERFQAARRVDVHTGRPQLTFWQPTRNLRLLDLANNRGSEWLIRHGASHSLQHVSRAICRAWAREIRAAAPGLDGLWVQSRMTGRPVVVLWEPARNSFPEYPEATAALAVPAVRTVVAQAALELGYR